MNKYFIHTLGCKVNRYETQLISENFNMKGSVYVDKPEDADIIILNSCTVTAQADKECEYFLRKVSKIETKPEIILTGCFAINKAEHIKKLFPNISIVLDKSELYSDPKNQMIKNFDKRSRAFLKIQDGCNSFCSYCIIPYIRNTMWSKPQETIIEEIKNLVNKGYSEIVLTGIHIGKYEGGISALIEKIIEIPLDFRIRISSIELNEIDDRLIEAVKYSDKICSHLHIPLQSGSDEILKKMNRHYSLKDFENKILKIAEIKEIALTTDIITGFPGESVSNHKEMCSFIMNMPFARFHIFRYSDREGTAASKFPEKVNPKEIKRRSEELFEIDSLKRKVFIKENLGKKRSAVSIGKSKALTDNYITVTMDKKRSGIFEVKINERSKI